MGMRFGFGAGGGVFVAFSEVHPHMTTHRIAATQIAFMTCSFV
jgi:hypothetical protein